MLERGSNGRRRAVGHGCGSFLAALRWVPHRAYVDKWWVQCSQRSPKPNGHPNLTANERLRAMLAVGYLRAQMRRMAAILSNYVALFPIH